MSRFEAKLMNLKEREKQIKWEPRHYKVIYVGLVEGYDIRKTYDNIDNFEVFATFREAKRQAIDNAISDIELAKEALATSRKILKKDVLEEW